MERPTAQLLSGALRKGKGLLCSVDDKGVFTCSKIREIELDVLNVGHECLDTHFAFFFFGDRNGGGGAFRLVGLLIDLFTPIPEVAEDTDHETFILNFEEQIVDDGELISWNFWICGTCREAEEQCSDEQGFFHWTKCYDEFSIAVLNLLSMKADCKTSQAVVSTPLGMIRVEDKAGLITAVKFTDETVIQDPSTAVLTEAVRQLEEYFEGRRVDFDLPLAITGTPFRQRCWRSLLQIPYGETRSYAEQAESVGGKRFARAVGQANHHNPYTIVIPCHRVVSSDGQLGGYAGGLSTKQWLLDHERSKSLKGSSRVAANMADSI